MHKDVLKSLTEIHGFKTNEHGSFDKGAIPVGNYLMHIEDKLAIVHIDANGNCILKDADTSSIKSVLG